MEVLKIDKYLKNASVYLIERVATMGLNFIVGVALARNVLPEQFGNFGYLIGLIGITLPLSKWAYDAVLVREMVQRPEDSRAIIGQGIKLRLIGSVFAAIVALSINHFLSDSAYQIVLFLCLIFIGNALTIPDSFFQAQTKAVVSSGAKIAANLVVTLLRLYLILYIAPFRFDLYLATYVVEPFVQAGILWVLTPPPSPLPFKGGVVVENGTPLPKRGGAGGGVSLFKSSLPLALMAFVSLLNARGDFLIIKQLLGAAPLATYSVAAKWSEVWYFLPTIFGLAYFPFIAKQQKDTNELSPQNISLVQKLSGRGVVVGVAIAVVMQFLAEPLLAFIYDNKYNAAATVLQIHIWAGVFIFLGHPISKIIIARKQEKYLLYVKLIATAINFALNYWLIPQIGIIGAAWASLVSYAVGSCLGYWVFKETRDLFYLEIKSLLFWKTPNIKHQTSNIT